MKVIYAHLFCAFFAILRVLYDTVVMSDIDTNFVLLLLLRENQKIESSCEHYSFHSSIYSCF